MNHDQEELRKQIYKILGTAKEGEIKGDLWINFTTEYKYQLLTEPILDIITHHQAEVLRRFAESVKQYRMDYPNPLGVGASVSIVKVEDIDDLLATMTKEGNGTN